MCPALLPPPQFLYDVVEQRRVLLYFYVIVWRAYYVFVIHFVAEQIIVTLLHRNLNS